MSTPTDDQAVEAFRAALRHPTLAGPGSDPAPFQALEATLREHFPRLFEVLELHRVGGHALLLHWRGTSDDDPLVLLAHQDVVPVEPVAAWTHPPFDAVLDDGMVWGRGTLDDKGSLVAICAGVERLLHEGVTPRRDVWLFFGSDEEVMGHTAEDGVAWLGEHDVTPWMVVDEGGALAYGAFPGVRDPLAMIGLAEKGVVDLELHATGAGGHAATPPRNGAAALLSRAILALERSPSPASAPPTVLAMVEAISAATPRAARPALKRMARSPRALTALFARLGPETAAQVRTTRAVTQLRGSAASNVLATSATAHVNLRVATGETADEAVERVRSTVRASGVDVRVLDASDPSPVAPHNDPAYRLLVDVTRELMPDATAAPYVMSQATDARHFHRQWPRVYRFTPFRMTAEQRDTIHNVDERITVDSWLEGVTWYARLIERL